MALIGSGGLQVSPTSIAFPTTGVGTISSPVTLTVTNLGAAYSLSGLALTAPSGFQLVLNTCASTLPAQSSCTVGVEFAPGAAGQQTGSLTVTSSTVQAAPVALSGTGFDFSVGITGPASQTVAQGQTASYSILICGAGGCAQNPFLPVGGTFTFTCGTLPTNALCLFNPTTQTLNAGVQGNVLVEISTGNASTVRLQKPDAANPGPGRPAFLLALPLACGLLLVPLAVCRRRKLFLLAVFVAIFAAGVSSCTSSGGGTGGGGSGGNGGGSNTPTGTYTIPVSVTSMGITQSVNVTLTVD